MTNVFISHIFAKEVQSFIRFYGLENSILERYILEPFFKGGAFGVTLFFLITGYVITLSIQKENYKQFLIRRIFRIYPSLLLALSAYWMVSMNYSKISFKVFAGSASLFGDFIYVPNQLKGVDWTLRVEIVFYAIVFLNLIFIKLNYKKIIFAIVIPILICILVLSPSFPVSITWNSGYLNIFFPSFIGGISIALLHIKKQSVPLAYISFFISLLLCYYNLVRLRPDLIMNSFYILYGYLIFFLFQILIKKENKFLHIGVFKRFVYWIASLTYIIYLFHNWLIDYVESRIQQNYTLNSDSYITPKLLALTLFLFFVTTVSKYFEKPLIKISKNFK